MGEVVGIILPNLDRKICAYCEFSVLYKYRSSAERVLLCTEDSDGWHETQPNAGCEKFKKERSL